MTEDQAYVGIWKEHAGSYHANVNMTGHPVYAGVYVDPWLRLAGAPFRAGPRTTVCVHSIHYHRHSAGYFRSIWDRAI